MAADELKILRKELSRLRSRHNTLVKKIDIVENVHWVLKNTHIPTEKKHDDSFLAILESKICVLKADSKAMSDAHRLKITKNRKLVKRDLQIDGGILDDLAQEGILTDFDEQKIASKLTPDEKIECLLQILPKKGELGFYVFQRALYTGSQPWLAKVLEDDRTATTMMRCELDSPNKNAHLDVAIQLFDNVHEDVCRQACEVMQARGLGHLRYLRRECIIFRVQFESLVELDQYWDTNSCPEKRQKLSKDLGKVLITDEIKKAAKDAPLDIKIQTNLSYEEYLSKRRHFMKGRVYRTKSMEDPKLPTVSNLTAKINSEFEFSHALLLDGTPLPSSHKASQKLAEMRYVKSLKPSVSLSDSRTNESETEKLKRMVAELEQENKKLKQNRLEMYGVKPSEQMYVQVPGLTPENAAGLQYGSVIAGTSPHEMPLQVPYQKLLKENPPGMPISLRGGEDCGTAFRDDESNRMNIIGKEPSPPPQAEKDIAVDREKGDGASVLESNVAIAQHMTTMPQTSTVESPQKLLFTMPVEKLSHKNEDEDCNRTPKPLSPPGPQRTESNPVVDKELVLDTVFCFDTSVSMTGKPLADLKRASNLILDGIEFSASTHGIVEKVAIIQVGSYTRRAQTLTTEYSHVRKLIDSLTAGGGAEINEGIVEAHKEILNHGGRLRIAGRHLLSRIIVFTDGIVGSEGRFGQLDNKQPDRMRVLHVATLFGQNPERVHRKVRKVMICCVGCGDFDKEFLESITEVGNGYLAAHNNQVDLRRLGAYYRRTSFIFRFAAPIRDTAETKTLFCSNKRMFKAWIKGAVGHESIDIEDEEEMDDLMNIMNTLATEAESQRPSRTNTGNQDSSDDEEVARFKDTFPFGARVRRGPDWKGGDEDDNGPGTVVKHDRGGWLYVQWDHSHIRHRYRAGADDCYDVFTVNETRELRPDEIICVGVRVKRGPDWKWRNQDGGPGSIGVVYKVEQNGVVHIRWPNGRCDVYRFGYEGCFDVETYSEK